RKGVEDRVEIVQRVPDFIDRALLGVSQAAVGSESLFFKKEANLVAGVEEVIVAHAGLLSSRKDRGAASRVEIADEIFGAALQSLTLFTSGEVLDHEEPVAFVRLELLCRKRDHDRGADFSPRHYTAPFCREFEKDQKAKPLRSPREIAHCSRPQPKMMTTGLSFARNMSRQESVAMPNPVGPFTPDLAMVTPAAASIPTTAGATPARKAWTWKLARKRLIEAPAIIVMTKDGKNAAIVVIIAPMTPATLYPMNVAVISTGPGVIWPNATPSANV